MTIESLKARVLDGIMERGWFDIFVGADSDFPNFHYTIGMDAPHGGEWTHPELICIGLPPVHGHHIFGNMVEQVKEGRSFTDDGPYDGVIQEPYHIRIGPVAERHKQELMHWTRWYYRDEMLEVLGKREFEVRQVLWPDEDGHFPGEPEFSKSFQVNLSS